MKVWVQAQGAETETTKTFQENNNLHVSWTAEGVAYSDKIVYGFREENIINKRS